MSGATSEAERLLDIDEVARRLGFSPWTIRRWPAHRFIPGFYLGKELRWREADVNAWIVARAAAQEAIEASATNSAKAKRKARG